MPTRRHFVALASAAAAAGPAPPVRSQANVVNRNTRLVVGFPAGSSPDVVARLLAEHMKGYAPSIIVDNRPGAGGRLPLEALKGAERDGTFAVLTPRSPCSPTSMPGWPTTRRATSHRFPPSAAYSSW